MRTRNAYQSLNEAQQRTGDGHEPTGPRYETLRETQYGVDDRLAQDASTRQGAAGSQPTLQQRMDAIESRMAALDKELEAMRVDQTRISTGAAQHYTHADIDRLFAEYGEPEPEPATSRETQPRDSVGPQRWTERGGMVEQQASAMEWLKHNAEQRQQPAPERARGGEGLSPDDLSVLRAAREDETRSREQEMDRGRDYPAP